MKKSLVVQILGVSDVKIGSEEGRSRLIGYSLEEVEYCAQQNDQEIIDNTIKADFPLIRQIQEHLKAENDFYLAVILTNQAQWIEQQNVHGTEWNQFIASDGHWWNNILRAWCEQENINYHPLILNITPEISKGAADWEGMAELIDNYLKDYIFFNEDLISFKISENQTIDFDRIIIQHSSGTPALSSALYLWGIEQKLAKQNIEFVYISRQDSIYYGHSGSHWQWRLKVPQIHQLLRVQDFSGVLLLLDDHFNEDLKNEVKNLDWAVSLNIAALKNTMSILQNLSPQAEVIERISIAIWSEKAFRERGQWMHWYMRVAGAFELTIFFLVERQGNGFYQWISQDEKISLIYPNSKTKTQSDFNMGIKKVVDLLSTGSVTERKQTYVVTAIQDSGWNSFKQFYGDNKGWILKDGNNPICQGFLDLRNKLYHTLQGDIIDQQLDDRTQELGSVTHPNHPSEFVMKQLDYLINLAGLKCQVEQRVKFYQDLVNTVKENL